MKDAIKKILLEGFSSEHDLSDLEYDYDLIESGLLTSFHILRLINKLETLYSIIIQTSEITPENFYSIESIYSLIQQKVEG